MGIPRKKPFPKSETQKTETKGDKIRKEFEKFKKKFGKEEINPSPPSRKPGEQKEMIPLRPEGMTPMAKGGRAGYKMGSKGCKLAKKGKGRAYGKNS